MNDSSNVSLAGSWEWTYENVTSSLISHTGNLSSGNVSDFGAGFEQVMQINWSEVINSWFIPLFLLIVGTSGNFLTGVIMWRKPFRKQSASIYLFFLAIADTVSVWTGYTSLTFYNVIVEYPRKGLSDWTCRISNFLYFSSTYISSWMIVGMAVERTIAVALPHKAKVFCSRKKTYRFCAGFTFIACAFCCHFFFTVKEGPYGCFWDTHKIKGNLDILVGHIVDSTMYSLLPFSIIIVCNGIIIYKLRQRQAWLSNLGKYGSGRDATDDHNRLTVLLLSISFFFLVTVSPICIAGFMDIVCLYGAGACPITWNQNHQLKNHIVNSLETLNHSANFFLYCLSGPSFRHELKKLFSSAKKDESSSAGEDLTCNEGGTRNEPISTIM